MTNNIKAKILNEYYNEGLTLIEKAQKHSKLTREEFLKIIDEAEIS